jgi:hypothetical protein
MLAMRMHTEGLDREERMYPGSASVETPHPQPAAQMTTTTQPASMTSTMTPPEATSGRADDMRKKPDIAAILAPVMERWAEEDSKDAANEEGATTSPACETTASAPCTTDVLEGVDQPLRDALRAAGYATLSSLVEVEPLVLSRATGRTYSEACRVSFLAKRALKEGMQGAPKQETAPATTTAPMEPQAMDQDEFSDAERILKELTGDMECSGERFSPSAPESCLPQDPHADEGDQEGPGGPFA